jgi:hypothetical protein
MELMSGPFEDLADVIASVVLPIAIAGALAAASVLAFEIAVRWFCDARGPSRSRQTLFVGRWGDFGPELYLVGKRVRKLANPRERAHATVALEFSGLMLAEVIRHRPANQLASAYANACLGTLPPDGFVISKSDVETWLGTVHDRAAYARRGA